MSSNRAAHGARHAVMTGRSYQNRAHLYSAGTIVRAFGNPLQGLLGMSSKLTMPLLPLLLHGALLSCSALELKFNMLLPIAVANCAF